MEHRDANAQQWFANQSMALSLLSITCHGDGEDLFGKGNLPRRRIRNLYSLFIDSRLRSSFLGLSTGSVVYVSRRSVATF